MRPTPADDDAANARRMAPCWPALADGPLDWFQPTQGFSGAMVWRVGAPRGTFALRAWPAAIDATRLRWVHRSQDELAEGGFHLTPRLERTASGETLLQAAGRWWELSSWRPGLADFHAQPSRGRLRQAALALAEIHERWRRTSPATLAPCPSVQARLRRLQAWTPDLIRRTAAALRQVADTELRDLLACVLSSFQEKHGAAAASLAAWVDRPTAQQRTLCDLWHDHLLFSGEQLTGVVDLGGMRLDAPAVALARMLDSLVGSQPLAWAAAVASYRSAAPFGLEQEALLRTLQEIGAVLIAETWLRWLLVERRPIAAERAAARLRPLVASAPTPLFVPADSAASRVESEADAIPFDRRGE